jgi:hypothetical protein
MNTKFEITTDKLKLPRKRKKQFKKDIGIEWFLFQVIVNHKVGLKYLKDYIAEGFTPRDKSLTTAYFEAYLKLHEEIRALHPYKRRKYFTNSRKWKCTNSVFEIYNNYQRWNWFYFEKRVRVQSMITVLDTDDGGLLQYYLTHYPNDKEAHHWCRVNRRKQLKK